MEELTVAGLPYSTFYPERVHRNHKILNFTPPGKAPGTYILHPHYEWATINLPEDNDIWYAKWEQTYNANPQNSLIRDGCTYVSFIKNPNDFTIQYRMHHPFNASAGRHEGDLPTIRVTIDSQDPSIADIVSVSYPIHGISSVRTTKVTYDPNFAESLNSETFNDEGNSNPVFANKYFVLRHECIL